MRRGLWTAGAVAVVLVTATLSFAAGRSTSPQQRAAQARPPAETVATAEAVMRTMTPTVTGRGKISYARAREIPIEGGEGGDVVTATTLRAGQRLSSGDVLLEVEGHPVLALQAPFSPYRDLHVGDTGRDVTVLKAALRGLGYATSTGKTLDDRDLRALESKLHLRGYSLPTEQAEPVDRVEPTGQASHAGPRSTAPAPTAPVTRAPAAAAQTAGRRAFLPRSWWVGVAPLPAQVAQRGPTVGEKLSRTRSRISLTRADPVLIVTIAQASVSSIVPGLNVTLAGPAGEQTWTIAGAEEAPGRTSAPTGSTVLVLRTVQKLPGTSIDSVGKITIAAARARTQLCVPITAVVTGDDGSPAVRVRDTGGAFVPVRVRLGDQLDGWVVVVPPDPKAIMPGTVVRLG